MMGVRSVSGQDLHAPSAQSSVQNPRTEEGAKAVPKKAPNRVRDVSEQEREQTVRAEKRRLEVPGAERTGTRLRVDNATERIVAQVLGQGNEVIKQIPPEEQLKVIANVREMQRRLLDEQV